MCLLFHCEQSEKDQAEMKQLRETVEQQSKTIKRFNRGESKQTAGKEQLNAKQRAGVKAQVKKPHSASHLCCSANNFKPLA